jgi:tRNA dimethylallyltransferase
VDELIIFEKVVVFFWKSEQFLHFVPMIHSQQRVVVVTGATGTGKSKLGVDLALALRPIVECEIVSCDAMQVYNGLTIATNQITPEEQCGVPHHLIGCQDALNPIDVVEFARRAWQCIEQIHQRGHLPIIVAGTLYYLEAILGLLIPQSRPSNNNNNNQRISDDQNEEERRISEKKQLEDVEEWKKLSDEEVSALLRTKSRKELIEWTTQQNTTFLFSILERLDPIRARKLHPHDTRRVVNSLLV